MADLLKLKIVTPDKIFHEGDTIIVELMTTEGQIGVYANHIPLMAIISPGVLKIHEESQVKKASLISGFMEILPEQMVIIAEVAEWPEEINANHAEEAHVRVEGRLKKNSTETDTLRAKTALKRTLTRLEARQQAEEVS